jgi:hypothetical protein
MDSITFRNTSEIYTLCKLEASRRGKAMYYVTFIFGVCLVSGTVILVYKNIYVKYRGELRSKCNSFFMW